MPERCGTCGWAEWPEGKDVYGKCSFPMPDVPDCFEPIFRRPIISEGGENCLFWKTSEKPKTTIPDHVHSVDQDLEVDADWTVLEEGE